MQRQREVRVWGKKNKKYPLNILSLRWFYDVHGGRGGDTGVQCLGTSPGCDGLADESAMRSHGECVWMRRDEPVCSCCRGGKTLRRSLRRALGNGRIAGEWDVLEAKRRVCFTERVVALNQMLLLGQVDEGLVTDH